MGYHIIGTTKVRLEPRQRIMGTRQHGPLIDSSFDFKTVLVVEFLTRYVLIHTSVKNKNGEVL